jgi:hypothetical protein
MCVNLLQDNEKNIKPKVMWWTSWSRGHVTHNQDWDLILKNLGYMSLNSSWKTNPNGSTLVNWFGSLTKLTQKP